MNLNNHMNTNTDTNMNTNTKTNTNTNIDIRRPLAGTRLCDGRVQVIKPQLSKGLPSPQFLKSSSPKSSNPQAFDSLMITGHD